VILRGDNDNDNGLFVLSILLRSISRLKVCMLLWPWPLTLKP